MDMRVAFIPRAVAPRLGSRQAKAVGKRVKQVVQAPWPSIPTVQGYDVPDAHHATRTVPSG